MLNAVVAKGSADDVSKVFHGVREVLITSAENKAGLAKWCYDHRNTSVGSKTIAAYFSDHYASAHDDVNLSLRKAIVEEAFTHGGIGNDNDGVISVIKKGFLPKEALLDRYTMFGRTSGSLLFVAIHHAAATQIAKAPKLVSLKNKTTVARFILNGLLDGMNATDLIQKAISDQVCSVDAAQAALVAIDGSVQQDVVSALVQALKTKVGVNDWSNLCAARVNGNSHNLPVWSLLYATVQGNPDETAAKAPTLLDYQ